MIVHGVENIREQFAFMKQSFLKYSVVKVNSVARSSTDPSVLEINADTSFVVNKYISAAIKQKSQFTLLDGSVTSHVDEWINWNFFPVSKVPVLVWFVTLGRYVNGGVTSRIWRLFTPKSTISSKLLEHSKKKE